MVVEMEERIDNLTMAGKKSLVFGDHCHCERVGDSAISGVDMVLLDLSVTHCRVSLKVDFGHRYAIPQQKDRLHEHVDQPPQ